MTGLGCLAVLSEKGPLCGPFLLEIAQPGFRTELPLIDGGLFSSGNVEFYNTAGLGSKSINCGPGYPGVRCFLETAHVGIGFYRLLDSRGADLQAVTAHSAAAGYTHDGVPESVANRRRTLDRNASQPLHPALDLPAVRAGRQSVNRGQVNGYGHFTSGGMEERMASTLPPVLRPKVVPRS